MAGLVAPPVTPVDAAGNPIGAAGATPLATRIQDGAAAALMSVAASIADGAGFGFTKAQADAYMRVFNGTDNDRLRSASAANLIAQSGLGAALVAPPGQWTATAQGAAGAGASVSQAAGGAGVRHVITAFITALTGNTTLVAAATQTAFVRDGASGAGTVKAAHVLALQGVAGAMAPLLISPPINLPGAPATAATVEFGAGVTNAFESVTITGYDAS